MRVTVWCLACALIACGKSQRKGDGRDQGVAAGASAAGSGGSGATSSGAGGDGISGSDSGGALTSGTAGTGGVSSSGGGSDAGGRQASGAGGMSAHDATNAGSGGGDAGTRASAGDGGSSGDGEVGSAGAAGTLECGGEYVACGCGCCDGTPATPVCYYPGRGDSLATIKRDDQTAALSPSCAGAGCAGGLRYTCCALPSELPPAMSESVTGGMVSPDIYRVSLYRTGTDGRCQVAQFARGDGPGRTGFPITLPEGWSLELLEDYLCADANSQSPSKRRSALGASGELGFSGTSGECRVKFDFAAFFASQSGDVNAVEFVSDWQSSPVVPECG